MSYTIWAINKKKTIISGGTMPENPVAIQPAKVFPAIEPQRLKKQKKKPTTLRRFVQM